MKKLKIIQELEKRGFEVLQNNVISDKHLDSFWYDELVLEFKFRGKIYRVEATGEIRIFSKKGELVFDGKERNSGFNFKLKDDNSLRKIGSNYDDDYYWDENNWFDIYYDNGTYCPIDDLSQLKTIELEEPDELHELIQEKMSQNG